jgi:hypothetical protein
MPHSTLDDPDDRVVRGSVACRDLAVGNSPHDRPAVTGQLFNSSMLHSTLATAADPDLREGVACRDLAVGNSPHDRPAVTGQLFNRPMPHSTPATAAADPDLVLGDTLDDSVARREAFPLWARERGPGYAPKAPASELISQEALRALVAAAEPDDVAGALSVLPCAQLTRVVGAAVASLPDDDAARVLGGAALSLDDDAAGELSRFLASTWISENLLGLAEQLVTFLSQRTLGGAVSDTLLHDSLTRLRRLETRVKAEKYRRIRESTLAARM